MDADDIEGSFDLPIARGVELDVPVEHPINKASVIIADVKRTIGRLNNIDGATGNISIPFKAGKKVMFDDFPFGIPFQPNHLVPIGPRSVPGTVQGHECATPEALASERTSKKCHTKRSVMSAKAMFWTCCALFNGHVAATKIGVRDTESIDVGPPIELPVLDAIELTGGEIVSQEDHDHFRRVECSVPRCPGQNQHYCANRMQTPPPDSRRDGTVASQLADG